MGQWFWRRMGCAALGICAGCVRPPDPAEVAELAQVKAQGRALNASLDALGVRLLYAQHRLMADTELQLRHQNVSEIACSNLAGHWAGINRFLDNQRDKAHRLRMARVAAASH